MIKLRTDLKKVKGWQMTNWNNKNKAKTLFTVEGSVSCLCLEYSLLFQALSWTRLLRTPRFGVTSAVVLVWVQWPSPTFGGKCIPITISPFYHDNLGIERGCDVWVQENYITSGWRGDMEQSSMVQQSSRRHLERCAGWVEAQWWLRLWLGDHM